MGAVGPLFIVDDTFGLTGAFLMMTMGLRFAFTNTEILTSFIDETIPAKSLKPRIADLPDVGIINRRNKITMTSPVQEKHECWLAEQVYFNPNCKINPAEAIARVSDNLDYSEIVNMQDVTGLERQQFTDIFDLGQAKPSISKTFSKNRKGKMVNFLEMFSNPENIDDSETLYASTITDNVQKNIN